MNKFFATVWLILGIFMWVIAGIEFHRNSNRWVWVADAAVASLYLTLFVYQLEIIRLKEESR